jgi:hypothetical protein
MTTTTHDYAADPNPTRYAAVGELPPDQIGWATTDRDWTIRRVAAERLPVDQLGWTILDPDLEVRLAAAKRLPTGYPQVNVTLPPARLYSGFQPGDGTRYSMVVTLLGSLVALVAPGSDGVGVAMHLPKTTVQRILGDDPIPSRDTYRAWAAERIEQIHAKDHNPYTVLAACILARAMWLADRTW